ncbi:mttA/Hcf106 family protein [Candidatus Endolissoclinum faulkneri L2]|uniref:MttA/Hcf106 family protein n=1 Tax=Candidatus Endolissoclinum faulkneri L2 TaxID=1193729 RepID=K7YNP3_9PROT|nr:twin-arginine translocase TatA/TatE family subunit [Candidatus Endolissoclinum faulkneri]AFX99167.1 mttA/Hcf106 family protein [Candidatus Endolissoclinum faulkneri L2]
MFELGWQECVMVAIVTIIVVGPKELPYVMRAVGRWMRKVGLMVREFQSLLEEAELDDVQGDIRSSFEELFGNNFNIQSQPQKSKDNAFKEMYKSVNAKLIFDEVNNEHDDSIYNSSRMVDIACNEPDKTSSSFLDKTTLSLSSMSPENDSANTHLLDENAYSRHN